MKIEFSGKFVRRMRVLMGVVLCSGAGIIAIRPMALNSASTDGPDIEFDSKEYDFGNVLAGEPIVHVFKFRNAGNQDLVLSRVQPGCGCTTAGDWTRVVAPGGEGVIPVQIRSAGFNGAVNKGITVTCNDSRHPVVSLTIKGIVQRAMEIKPSVGILNLTPDSPFGSATLQITNRLKEPLIFSPPQTTNNAFGVILRTNLPGYDYSLIVSNTTVLPGGSAQADIALPTSLAKLPVVHVLALATVSPPFTVVPQQIQISSEMSASNTLAYVTLISHSTNPVSLYEPDAGAKEVNVSIKETKPGTMFAVSLSFPAGYQAPAAPPTMFRIKTSNPRFPVVEIPITQTAHAEPVAPLVKNQPPDIQTAPLPLVFRTAALASLKLSSDQRDEIDELGRQFVQEIGGMSQDPSDPAYLARWQRARPKSDAMLTAVVGRRALMQLDQASSPADASSE